VSLLPAGFAELEPFVDAWCVETEPERWARRLASSMEEMRAFYDAMFARADEAMDYCDSFPLHEMPDDARRLFRLLEALALVSYAVEVWGQPLPVNIGSALMERTREPRLWPTN
jgi:hypothetical protein